MTMPHIVRDVMTTDVVSVSRLTPFKELAAVLSHRRINAVPVLDNRGRVVGVVSQADLLPKQALRDYRSTGHDQLLYPEEFEKAAAMVAADLMTSPAVTIGPHATLGEAARLMARNRVRQLPVVDELGASVGFLARGDLLKVFLMSDDELCATVQREVLEYLPAIGVRDLEINVTEGVVTIDGWVDDARMVPVVVGFVRTVEGVVGVDCRLRAGPGSSEPSGLGPLL